MVGGRNVPKQTRRDRKKRYSLDRIRLKKKRGGVENIRLRGQDRKGRKR